MTREGVQLKTQIKFTLIQQDTTPSK